MSYCWVLDSHSLPKCVCVCVCVHVLILLLACVLNLCQNDFNFEKRDWFTVKPNELPTGSKLVRNDILFPFKNVNEFLQENDSLFVSFYLSRSWG